MPLCYVHNQEFPRESMQEHHKRPRAYGGPDVPDNIVWICSGDHDLLHRSAQRLYANKAGEAKDMVVRHLPNYPAGQKRLWDLVLAVAHARRDHARSSEIPEAGVDAEDPISTVKMSLDLPDWLHHRLKTLATGKGLYKYVMGVLENHAVIATQKPGASEEDTFAEKQEDAELPEESPLEVIEF